MTTAHQSRLLSLDDWDALPADNGAHIELQEGVLIVSPKPMRPHLCAAFRIARQLNDQLPAGFEAFLEFEVVVDEAFPPTVRVPDVVVTRSTGPDKRLTAFHLAGEVGYAEPPAATGTVATTLSPTPDVEPITLQLDLDGLTTPC